MFVTSKVPLFETFPVEATLIPEPVFNNDIVPLLLTSEPETLTAPFEFDKVVLPFPLETFPEILIPFEPEFVSSVFPAPKFFMAPATLIPPSAPYDVILIVPLLFAKEFPLTVLSALTN